MRTQSLRRSRPRIRNRAAFLISARALGRTSGGGVVVVLAALVATGCQTVPLTGRSAEATSALVVEDVRVVVGDGRVLEHQDVSVMAGRIAHVAPHKTLPPASGAIRLSGAGRTLLPGLIDSHVHIEKSGAPPWSRESPNPDHNLEAHLFSGVTTVVDLGGRLTSLKEAQTRVETHGVEGPRLFFAGPMVTVPDGYPLAVFRRLGPQYIPFFVLKNTLLKDTVAEVETPAQARAVVEEIHRGGAKFLKIVVAKTFADDTLSGTLLKTLVAEAHLRRLVVFAHVATPEDAVQAALAGVDVLAHGPALGALDDSQIATLADHSVAVVPTLSSYDRFEELRTRAVSFSALEHQSEDAKMLASMSREEMTEVEIHPDLITFAEEMHSHAVDRTTNLAALQKRGITILTGTDANGAPGVFPATIHQELQALVDGGLTPSEALMAATWNAARTFDGENADYGKIVEGARADLVLVDGNPTVSVADTANIVHVVKLGQLVERQPWSTDAAPVGEVAKAE